MMKRLFRSKKKEKEKNDESGDVAVDSKKRMVSWPTAMERVDAARQAKAMNGGVLMPTRANSPHTRMMFSAEIGKELLRRYEDCKGNDGDNSDSDEDEEEASSAGSGGVGRCPMSSTTKLHKPVKPNRLLMHALTNANGDAWRRQRPLVQRALGDAAVTKKIAVPAATKAALAMLQETATTSDNNHPDDMQLEVRQFALKVATSTMIASVFGNDVGEETHKLLETGIHNLFHPTLLPVRGDEEKAMSLDGPVRETVQDIANNMATASSQEEDYDNVCLAFNLLRQEAKELSRDEVIGNCHSALLAGTQTIATTLAGCMLHLATFSHDDNTDTKIQAADRSWCRAVVNETLRILPPVASLPRCPVHGKLPIPTTTTASMSDSDTVFLDEGGVLLLDVLSMAHCGPVNDIDMERSPDHGHDNDTNTWAFCLDKTKERKVPKSYPWGFGDRICPAGNLSVSCISAVLEVLLAQEGWTWRLANENDHGWMATVSYQPTLTYPSPLWLTLSKGPTTS